MPTLLICTTVQPTSFPPPPKLQTIFNITFLVWQWLLSLNLDSLLQHVYHTLHKSKASLSYHLKDLFLSVSLFSNVSQLIAYQPFLRNPDTLTVQAVLDFAAAMPKPPVRINC